MAGAESAVRQPIAGNSLSDTLGPRERVRCVCSHQIFDGIVIRSRVVRLHPTGGAEALCRCKRWVRVPVTYAALPPGR